ncbi:MAG: iron ABC transporter permease [Candidatus Omnitrophica bacterium]|nr:iron ABC transporter permease [Candidatus Omnitrophota bacterium]
MKNKLAAWIFWTVLLSLFLLATGLFSLGVGSSEVTLRGLISAITQGRNAAGYSILFDIRLPRIILGFAVGGSLSLAGVILQGMFRNPLVEPYTLGISGGAALGVALNIVLRISGHFGVLSLPISGFLGALIVSFLVYFLAVKKGTFRTDSFLLTGVMISFISSALMMLLMALSRSEDLQGIIFWMMGSLEEPSRLLLRSELIVAVLGLLASYLFVFDLNAFGLGEEEALHLGVNTERSKRILFVLAAVLTGFAVSVAGIIGFVGLVVPHFVRMFLGGDHRILLIGSFLSGAIFLILCYALARIVIAPLELPVGVITGILGGTLFVYAVSKKRI